MSNCTYLVPVDVSKADIYDQIAGHLTGDLTGNLTGL